MLHDVDRGGFSNEPHLGFAWHLEKHFTDAVLCGGVASWVRLDAQSTDTETVTLRERQGFDSIFVA